MLERKRKETLQIAKEGQGGGPASHRARLERREDKRCAKAENRSAPWAETGKGARRLELAHKRKKNDKKEASKDMFHAADDAHPKKWPEKGKEKKGRDYALPSKEKRVGCRTTSLPEWTSFHGTFPGAKKEDGNVLHRQKRHHRGSREIERKKKGRSAMEGEDLFLAGESLRLK